MALNYLLDPMFQIENTAGKPATDGWLEVYIHGTRTKYYCASNFDGTLHPFKIKLDSLGSNIVLADDGQAYDVYAYNRFGSLLMSRYNVQPGKGGSGSGGIVSELQHWLGGYGPTYTPFPGDDIGHTLGISTGRLQGSGGVDYVGDFIDHIETCPYPDGVYDGYIYLKPGLYYVDCIIRYQQARDSLSNTLDEVLVYTGYGNANESLAYQFDSTGPEATGNRHNLRVSFVRHVTENEGSILYFAPATPVNWKEAYIQKLQIVKLDGVKGERGDDGESAYEVWLDQGNTGSEQDFLDSLQGPAGPQGVQGPAGPAGPQGPQGPKGADGDVSFDELTPEQIEQLRGPAGPQGPQGEQGEQGPQGVQGEQGPAGPTGPTGAAGHDGTTPPVVPLVAGTNINIEESNGSIVISADGGDESLWQVAKDGNIEPKDGKHFEAYSAPTYSSTWDHHYAKFNRSQSTEGGFEVDHMIASHVGDDTPWSAAENWAIVKTVFSSNPYMGAAQAGFTVLRGTDGSGQESRVDLRAGSPGTYTEESQVENTYVQAYRKGNYIRLRSDDIIHHVGNVNGHAPFVLAHQSDTTKTYVMQPTATAGVYELVEETSGGSSYTAGEGIDITKNVISVDPDSLPEGPQGPQGIQGPAGATGADGESAYDIWLDQGNTGTEQDFLDSLHGAQGPQGIQGIQGPKGDKGDTGEQGPAGAVPPVLNLTAGDNISITASGSNIVIGATGLATTKQLAAKADKATTLAGYGITDAYTKSQTWSSSAIATNFAEVDDALDTKANAATTYTKTEVDTALADKADAATTLAGYGITNAYTKSEVDSALSGKQATLTGITDVQVVQSLPASPVATVLYLIPEA